MDANLANTNYSPTEAEHIEAFITRWTNTGGQRLHGAHVATRGASDSQVDALRVHELQHLEVFRDLVRRVMRQHDATGADTNSLGLLGNTPDQDFGR